MNPKDNMSDAGFVPAQYQISVNGAKHIFTNPEPTTLEIMQKAGLDPATQALILMRPGEENRILPYDENQDLRQPGIEQFTFASTKREYVAYVDETRVVFEHSNPSGEEILQKVGKNSQTHALTQVVPGDEDHFIGPNERVDLSKLGIERFTTVIRDEITIIVNTREKVVRAIELTFDEVVALAFPTPPPGQDIVYTVKYRRGVPRRPQGSLVEGEKVRIKEGMIFNVTATDKS